MPGARNDPLGELRSEIEKEMDLMTAVSTGGPRIQDVQGEYSARRRRIRTLLRQLGLQDPNPHIDLWAWYGKWSRDFDTYAARRIYIRELFRPLLDSIDQLEEGSLGSGLPGSEVTGLASVDGQVAQLRIKVAACETKEDAQAVGLLCRDVMISLAQDLYDSDVHGDVGTSAVDQINAVIDYVCAGSSNERLRKLCKATTDFANVVQHRRDCSVADAGVVAEATIAVVNIVRRVVDSAED